MFTAHRRVITASASVALLFALIAVFAVPRLAHAAGGTSYYVNCAASSDGNGTSQSPWNSLNDVNTFNSPTGFQPGDHILFQAGTTCTGQLHPLGSGNSSSTITIDQTGSGALPKIDGQGTVTDVVYLYNQQYWDINNLDVTNDAASAALRTGVHIINATAGLLSHIHITGLHVHTIKGYGTGYYGDNAGISIQTNPNTTSTLWDDVLIQNNTFTTVDRVAVFVGPQGDATSTTGRNTHVDIRNNTMTDDGEDAVLVYNATSPVIEYNHVANGGSRGGGACPPSGYCNSAEAGMWVNSVDGGIFQYNTVINQCCTNDGEAFDADNFSTNITFRYNYTANNANGAYVFYGSPDKTIIHDNISQNDGSSGRGVLMQDGQAQNAQIYNNTFYISAATNAPFIDETAAMTASFKNNIIVNTGTGTFIRTPADPIGGTWDHNLITGYATTGINDAHLLTSDPQLVNPGSGGTDRTTLAGYKLLLGSPALGAGTLITPNDGLDFYGNAVSATAAPNIGAYDGAGVDTSINLARTATPFASSTLDNYGWALADVNDGIRTTTGTSNGWTSNNSLTTNHTEYVGYDLGSPQPFTEVDLYPRSDTGSPAQGFPIDFTIDVSQTGQANDWTSVVTQTGYLNPGTAVQQFVFAPQNARYVRVQGTNLLANPGEHGWYRMQFAEVEVYDHPTSNLARTATLSATSTLEGYGWALADVNDGIRTSTGTSNGWTSNSHLTADHTESVTFNLGATKTLGEVNLYPRSDTGPTTAQGFPIDFTIAVSPTGLDGSWTTVVSKTGYLNPGPTVQSFTFAAQTAHYVRVQGTKLLANPGENNWYRLQFAEIEVYGF